MSVSKVCVLACTIGAASAAAPRADELTAEYSFSQYKIHFGKTYSDAEEDASRQKIFAQNLKNILAHNAAGRSWKMGVNQFTDAKPEEIPMGNTLTKNLKLVEELKQQPHVGVHEMTGQPLPKTVDWRQHEPSVVSPVKNQGMCGDCWAHATVETVESHWAIQHPGRLWTLSQQQVTDCTEDPRHCGGTGGCKGALYELGWEQMKKGNIASEWVYPFTSYSGSSSSSNCHEPLSDTKVVVTGYKHVTNTTEALMDAVANVGPIAIGVAAEPWMAYESGVFDGCTYPVTIDHAVVLEGYGTDGESGQDYWLVRNSWSPAWGEDGYIRIHRPAKAPCGDVIHNSEGLGCSGDPSTIPGCGTCGILLDPAYPTLEQKNTSVEN